MRINLKDNIWIEGFDEFTFAYEKYNDLVELPNGTIYGGKTKNIPYSVAENCVKSYIVDKGSDSERTSGYFDYNRNEKSKWVASYDSPIDSIKSACDYEYCLIYKIS